MIKLLKRLKTKEGLQVFASLVIIIAKLLIDLLELNLPDSEKSSHKKPSYKNPRRFR